MLVDNLTRGLITPGFFYWMKLKFEADDIDLKTSKIFRSVILLICIRNPYPRFGTARKKLEPNREYEEFGNYSTVNENVIILELILSITFE